MSGNARERDGKGFSGSRVSRSATEGVQRVVVVVVVVDRIVDCLYKGVKENSVPFAWSRL